MTRAHMNTRQRWERSHDRELDALLRSAADRDDHNRDALQDEDIDRDCKCRECGAPFNNANPTKTGLCAACEA